MTREGSQHTGKGWNPANGQGRDVSIKLKDGLPSARTATDLMGWAPQWWQWRHAGPRIWPSCPGNHWQTYSLPMCGASTHDLPTENRENPHCWVFCFLSVLKSRFLRTKTTGPNTKTNRKEENNNHNDDFYSANSSEVLSTLQRTWWEVEERVNISAQKSYMA